MYLLADMMIFADACNIYLLMKHVGHMDLVFLKYLMQIILNYVTKSRQKKTLFQVLITKCGKT